MGDKTLREAEGEMCCPIRVKVGLGIAGGVLDIMGIRHWGVCHIFSILNLNPQKNNKPK